MQSAIVDAVEAALQTVILCSHSRQESSSLAKWDIEGVNTLVLAFGVKLRENYGRLAMECRISDVVLIAVAVWRVNYKLFAGWVIGSGRSNRCNV